MADNFHNPDKFRRPEQFLADILKKGIQGRYNERDENLPVLYRAAVVAVDVIGGKLQNPSPSSGDTVEHQFGPNDKISVKATVGPANPRNSIKARIISDGLDQFLDNSSLRVFWPFFPEHISIPIKPGEYVYVMFEDTRFLHGLWIAKIPGHEGVNYAQGHTFFQNENSDSLANNFPDTAGGTSSDSDYTTTAAAGESTLKDSTNSLSSKFPDTKGG